MTPVLIGYFAKRRAACPGWLAMPQVEEICSVSGCIAAEPENWINLWRHNAMFVFNTPELAWSVVPDDERQAFSLFAYKMIPARFDNGCELPFDIPQLAVEPLSSDFESLGWDVVSRSCGTSFECSPLSCNNMAEQFPVNRYCLLETELAAIQLAISLKDPACEPGPYHILEVFRQFDSGDQLIAN